MTSGPGVAPTTALTADDFLVGLIAALAVRGERQIAATPTELHRAFRRVLSELSKRQTPKVDLSDVDYDPLYGFSGWLDDFMARAQRDLLISFPYPSYGRIEIRITPEEGKNLLSKYGPQGTFEQSANLLIKELEYVEKLRQIPLSLVASASK